MSAKNVSAYGDSDQAAREFAEAFGSAHKRFFGVLIGEVGKALGADACLAAMALTLVAVDLLALYWGKEGKGASAAQRRWDAFGSEFLKESDARYDGALLYRYRCEYLHSFSSGESPTSSGTEVVLMRGPDPYGQHLQIASDGSRTNVVLHVPSFAGHVTSAANGLFARAAEDRRLAEKIVRISRRSPLLAAFSPSGTRFDEDAGNR